MPFNSSGTNHNSRRCSICESLDHHTKQHDKFEVKPKIKDKGFPTSSKHYPYAHERADIAEKKAFPKGYEKLKKVASRLPVKELLGKNTKAGKIEISAKVPKPYRKEVAMHEKKESDVLRKKKS